MLLKIIIDTLRAFVAGLVLSLACCCMMVVKALARVTTYLVSAAYKIRGVKCDVK